VGAADGRCQSPLAVLLDQVLEDRARFGQHHAVVLDRGKFSRGRVLLEGMTGRFEGHRRELVRNAELLEQPEDADRAGELRVVELDHANLPGSVAGTPRPGGASSASARDVTQARERPWPSPRKGLAELDSGRCIYNNVGRICRPAGARTTT